MISSKISDAISGTRHRCFLSDEIDSVLLNVVVDDSEDHNVDITSHAIEDGSDISDNTWQRPVELNLNCVLTDDISDLLDWSVMALTSIEDRKEILKSWMDDKIVLTLYSWDTDYEDILISGINYRRSAETGLGIGMQLSLKQVNIAESQLATMEIAGTTDKDNQPVKTETKQERMRSDMKSLQNLLKQAFPLGEFM